MKITLQPFAPFEMPVASIWWPGLYSVLSNVSPFIKVCWLKTVGGGWCTGVRLNSQKDRQCIFACVDARGEVCHYLVCPIIWSFALSILRIQEDSILFLNRIGVISPTPQKLKALAFCHSLYHTCVNDPECVSGTGEPFSSVIVQRRAEENCGFCVHVVGGRDS